MRVLSRPHARPWGSTFSVPEDQCSSHPLIAQRRTSRFRCRLQAVPLPLRCPAAQPPRPPLLPAPGVAAKSGARPAERGASSERDDTCFEPTWAQPEAPWSGAMKERRLLLCTNCHDSAPAPLPPVQARWPAGGWQRSTPPGRSPGRCLCPAPSQWQPAPLPALGVRRCRCARQAAAAHLQQQHAGKAGAATPPSTLATFTGWHNKLQG